ncbi:MAG: alginate export family protein [Proteobacteria bacterium]|nr:alginate export family protein [Pseudomonadota bacterium]
MPKLFGKLHERVMTFKTNRVFFLIGVAILLLHQGYGTSLAKEKEQGHVWNKLTSWGNARFRYEYQDNFNAKCYGDHPKKGEANDGFLLGRFRFGFHYYPSEIIHLAVGMQHSEAWDVALKESDFYNDKFGRRHNPYEDDWEPFDTYLEIKKLLPFSIKTGRQIMSYGDKRIYGPGQWGNTGRWLWDAAKLHYKFKGGFMDAYYGKTMVHDPSHLSWKHNHGFESVGFYGHFELPKNLLGIALEPFSMTKKNNRDAYKGEDGQSGDFDAYYVGARIFKKDCKEFDFDFTFITEDGDRADDDIDAYGYHLLMAYNFKQIGFKPRVSVEYSYASGDSDPEDGTLETFDGAFGARDKMYGRMNLFHWKNLRDAQINVEVKPENWLYLKAEYHQFWLAEREDAWYLNPKEYRDKSGNSGDKVGKEFDLTARLKLPKGNEIQFGFGHFWPDEFAKKQASDKEANWVFLQWMYRFSYPFF